VSGLLVALNTGRAQPLTAGRRTVESGIVKSGVAGRLRVGELGVEGDEQADPLVHGGPDKAVYAYAVEDYRWWSSGLGIQLAPATFGENLTVSGMEVSGAIIGERWRLGSALLEVAQPRLPCYKLGMRMGDPAFPARFTAANRPGAYLRVVEPGEIGAGDAIEVVDRPSHGVTIAETARAMEGDRSVWRHVATAPRLPEQLLARLLERIDTEDALPEVQAGG
jgi:MOSC domain-containing protein YiiM